MCAWTYLINLDNVLTEPVSAAQPLTDHRTQQELHLLLSFLSALLFPPVSEHLCSRFTKPRVNCLFHWTCNAIASPLKLSFAFCPNKGSHRRPLRGSTFYYWATGTIINFYSITIIYLHYEGNLGGLRRKPHESISHNITLTPKPGQIWASLLSHTLWSGGWRQSNKMLLMLNTWKPTSACWLVGRCLLCLCLLCSPNPALSVVKSEKSTDKQRSIVTSCYTEDGLSTVMQCEVESGSTFSSAQCDLIQDRSELLKQIHASSHSRWVTLCNAVFLLLFTSRTSQ